MVSKTTVGFGRGDIHWMRATKWELTHTLPEPGEAWIAYDVDLSQQMLKRALDTGVIDTVGERTAPYPNSHTGKTINVYETNPDAWEIIHRAIEQATPLLPCGHDGFTNPREIDGVRCKVSWCHHECDQAEVYRR